MITILSRIKNNYHLGRRMSPSTTAVVSCQNVWFHRGTQPILKGIDFTIERAGIVGLLGKNGAGKSTTIGVLMGYLRATQGVCEVLGDVAADMKPATRARIGLLHEGFTQYDYLTIGQIEAFYRSFYPSWRADIFWDLVGRMHVPATRRITKLSCGQRSQVTLGLILAQNAELLILDDFSLGLDVGYRRLFLEYLRHYVNDTQATVLLTSHVVSELESFLDDVLLIKKGEVFAKQSMADFKSTYHGWAGPVPGATDAAQLAHLPDQAGIVHVEASISGLQIFTTLSTPDFMATLQRLGVSQAWQTHLTAMSLSFEDIFVGITGRY